MGTIIQLVGFERLKVLDSLGELFPRLAEVKHAGDPARFVGWNSDGGEGVGFFGLQVERVEDVAEGMTSWTLTFDSLVSGGEARSLSWDWLDTSVQVRPVGEFTVDGSSFHLFSHGYMRPREPFDDDVCLVDYDPGWINRYLAMERWLKETLGPVALRIEHYGSTAIPGMPAKPVVDVLVEIPSFDEARTVAIPAFNRPECDYWWYRDHPIFIVREKLMGKRTHHVHMAPKGHRLWEGLAFRDYLREHPDDAARYARLKRDLASKHGSDREAYTDAKAEFVLEISRKAAT